MPSLTPEDRERLLGPCGECPTCHRPVMKNYCRQCDEFFYVCDCDSLDKREHEGHRTY